MIRTPPCPAGLRVGLFGGSFNPPHEGHVLVAKTALRRLGLDRVWWLVTPGNPLKAVNALPPLAERMVACRRLLGHEPRIVVSDLEARLGTRYTIDLVKALRRRCPGVRFVWLMGADNLAQFHRWKDWQAIAREMPLAVIDRPGSTLKAVAGKAARRFAPRRIDESRARRLPMTKPPAWLFLHGPRSMLSSTKLRAMQGRGS